MYPRSKRKHPTSPPIPGMRRNQAATILWQNGMLEWKLHACQKEFDAKYKRSKDTVFVINCSRRLGKSFYLVIKAVQICLAKARAQVRYAAPTAKQVKTIVAPLMQEILADCPVQLRPTRHKNEGTWEFPNGSIIYVAGCDKGNADQLRGVAADLAIVDEAGMIDDLDYAVKAVLLPQLLTTRGRLLMASTPPVSPSHPFAEYCSRAEFTDSYIHRTIYDSPLLDARAIEEAARSCGGKDTTEFRREYMAEFITESTRAVVPEFTPELRDRLTYEVERPPYYDAYVSMDAGFRDLSVLLFGYWDFLNAKLVIEDEAWLRGGNTEQLASIIKDKESELWGTRPPFRRIVDADPRLLHDLRTLHGLTFVATARDDREASINEMRVMLANEKAVLHPRLKLLPNHLQHAVWNRSRTEFDRSADHGHFDAVAALQYLIRNVSRHHNPYPETVDTFDKTRMIYAGERPPTHRNRNAVTAMLRRDWRKLGT